MSTLYPSETEFGSKQGPDKVEKMGMEVWFIAFVNPLEVGQSQDENLFGVSLWPAIYDLETSLITVTEK